MADRNTPEYSTFPQKVLAELKGKDTLKVYKYKSFSLMYLPHLVLKGAWL
jgi:hypothetical protein